MFDVLRAAMLLLFVLCVTVEHDALASPNAGDVVEHDAGQHNLSSNMQKLIADADGGSASAQYILAQLFYGGVYVDKDLVKARRWYRAAAEQGHSGAQFFLGVMFDIGEGGQTDDTAAIEWYKKAVAQGHVRAMVNLGAKYFRGQGVEQDFAKARELLEIASEHDDPRALYGLAVMYERGRGVPIDLCRAIKLLRRSAALGFTDAVRSLNHIGKPTSCEGI